MAIEPAALDELDTLVDLWVDLASEQRPHGTHVRPTENRTTMRERLARHVVDGSVLVDRTDDDIVGFVSFERTDTDLSVDAVRGLVSNLYVVPGYRGAGRGAALLSAAEAALRERGADVVQLEVMADNARALSFYSEQGYADHRYVLEKRVGVESHTKANDHD
ncbi:GNAT family N-acetyltransferase [Haloarchaeobius sp. FL176]|uniref:GNAT family N-acetyltransferase n=1 Tax=Haloarchaeobius sp. FL176 TaxID=2967129 RepID=UPI0021491798|nr:GNAT family N-acetyltransferase [Haloarchaeobius sp. FL176]